MHDGRFADLDAVLRHYSSGVQAHPNLSSELLNENGRPVRLHLSASDRDALKAFLSTLTDNTIIEDERYSDPFLATRPDVIAE
jgi:cytochrome c peroxidase